MMIRKIQTRRMQAVFLCCAVATATLIGCREDEPNYEIVTLEQARVETIDLKTGEITVSYYS